MIITRTYAHRLLRRGLATADGSNTYHDGAYWMIVDRHDLQRVDHYPASCVDVGRILSRIALAND